MLEPIAEGRRSVEEKTGVGSRGSGVGNPVSHRRTEALPTDAQSTPAQTSALPAPHTDP